MEQSQRLICGIIDSLINVVSTFLPFIVYQFGFFLSMFPNSSSGSGTWFYAYCNGMVFMLYLRHN